MNIDEDLLRKLIDHFGTERLMATLPQEEVRQALDLVSVQDLAGMLAMNYSTLHWHMSEGHILYPQIRLVRRAFYTREEADAIVKAWGKRN